MPRLPLNRLQQLTIFSTSKNSRTLNPILYQSIRKASNTTMDKSHAVGGSFVPEKAQEKLPQGVEESVPDTIHDTDSSKSHATGSSIVPEAVQKAVPKGVEEVLPNKIHDTSPGGVDTVSCSVDDVLAASSNTVLEVGDGDEDQMRGEVDFMEPLASR